ncbi:putative N-acetyltransferase [Lachnellula suecica]|uniref:Putative N-acetyltransferase n=1 Tax=Lachnellula suecica TaxID=602035 RepID=A0A8T9CRP9_9HELO|nr:putative N-acetyltransferase [Lachnellula suecica]
MSKFTSGGKECIPPATKLFAKAFETDPIITYMLSSMGTEARIAYLPRYFDALLTAAALNQASFMEADDWQSCSVLLSPGHRVDNTWTMLQAGMIPLLYNIGFKSIYRMMGEWAPQVDASKARTLGKEKKFYYVFFTATAEDARGKGLCSAIIKQQQEIAARDGLPLWIEATTEHSKGIYAKLGFETIDEIVLGKGKANADGLPCKGGPGVKTWTMIWRPQKQ